MNLLPKWVLPSTTPAVHDFESATVLEQTAKAYAALNALIAEYNKFADDVNGLMENFTEGESTARTEFECKIIKIYRDFQSRMNAKITTDLDASVVASITKLYGNGESVGLTTTEKTLLIEILEAALFDTDMSAKVAQLRNSFGI